MPDGWEYWDTQVYLFHVIDIRKKTKNYFFEGTAAWDGFSANSVPSCLERTKVGRDFAHFGALGECAKCAYAPSPTAHKALFLTS